MVSVTLNTMLLKQHTVQRCEMKQLDRKVEPQRGVCVPTEPQKEHVSKEITLCFPAIKTESCLGQLLLLGQFHVYGALLVKSAQLTLQQRFILY